MTYRLSSHIVSEAGSESVDVGIRIVRVGSDDLCNNTGENAMLTENDKKLYGKLRARAQAEPNHPLPDEVVEKIAGELKLSDLHLLESLARLARRCFLSQQQGGVLVHIEA